jgi:hypothetical protein
MNKSMDDIDLIDDSQDGEFIESKENIPLNSARSSVISTNFRDTELSHADAMKTMRISSLSSIVNQPKKRGFMKQLASMSFLKKKA